MNRLCAVAVLLVTACGGAPRIVRTSDGADVPFEAMVDALSPARLVLLGERHDQPGDHAMQEEVTAALLANDEPAALGFEMFQRPYQPVLDEYTAGSVDEAQLLARTEWEQRWGFDFAMYRPLVRFGLDGATLLALNAPQAITRTVGRQGLEGLSEAQRAELPELDLTDDAHRAQIMEAFAGHPGMTDAMRERFYTAQVIWDETMADTVATYLARSDAARRVIVYAGTMHVMRPAIPARVQRRVDATAMIVMPVAEADVAEASALADFLWVSEPE